jgi:hypothetical protein
MEFAIAVSMLVALLVGVALGYSLCELKYTR